MKDKLGGDQTTQVVLTNVLLCKTLSDSLTERQQATVRRQIDCLLTGPARRNLRKAETIEDFAIAFSSSLSLMKSVSLK
ncbi:hypothetical protein J6590_043469 [Homalodisca vitripennis]|nr:hypothetical protein J6590_043469 [Homalodisca vitripennis]